ncbi:HTH-type transcriptional activator RhaR [Paenibacillus allorhizoplanae]|uniref:HTH-type transcriptional activator RhaR n=1 Tax=Paenibacillus allorhizoplanae TaxID=2905648 RepID=A0ABM9BQZ7_9BACL|nr:helix-turn-helix domain-containing protein [Paenibacillus allorhizoplanae]CAH1192729.1 HTH-type transcriptional activator RhaR [Paenibacillus allorhizoplanae]
MKNVMTVFRKKNMLFKIILSYVLIGFLFISCFSYVVLKRVSSNMTEDIVETSSRMMNQTYNTADILLTFTYNYYSQLYLNNEYISKALNGTSFSTNDIYDINSQLGGFKNTNPLVSSIYVYNYHAGIVFNSAKAFSTIDDFFDKGMTDFLKEGDMTRNGLFIPRTATLSFSSDSNKIAKQDYISIVYTRINSSKEQNSMVLNLDQKVLQSLILKGNDERPNKMMIINYQGHIISEPRGWSYDDVSTQEILSTIVRSNSMRGEMDEAIQGKSFRISYVKSDNLGWNFVVFSEKNELLGKVHTLQNFILALTLVCILLITITSVFFTRIIYFPISHLLIRIKTTTETKEKVSLNEYDLINKSFSLLEDKVETLQTDFNQSVPVRRQSLLRSVLNGTVNNNQEVKVAMEKLQIGSAGDNFVVCVLKIDGFHDISLKYDMVDLSLFKFAIQNISQEIVSNTFKLEVIENGYDSLDFVFNIGNGDAEAHISVLRSLFADIQTNIRSLLKFSVTIGIGPVAHNMEQLRESRDSAYQTVLYRLIFGTNSILSFDDRIGTEFREYEYPDALEKQIMTSLKAGDTEALKEYTSEFFAEMMAFTYDVIIHSLIQLLIMTIRVAKSMSSLEQSDHRLEIHTCQQELLNLDTLEQMEAWYMNLCQIIIRLRDQESKSKNSKTVAAMVEYMKENYLDYNLSVDQMSQFVGLSTNYMRRLFKEEMNHSVSEYLTALRLEKAKELLVKTDDPARKIGENVGFENTNYFYVLFKKHVGMTPDHYRREHKLETLLME